MKPPRMRIRPVMPDRAGARLREIYREIERTRGRVWNLYLAHGHLPEVLQAHLDFYRHLMFGPGGLPRHLRELLGCYVSYLNACEY